MIFRKVQHPYLEQLNYADEWIKKYGEAEQITGTKPSMQRRDRFFNTISLFKSTKGVQGDVVELGCYRGLSSLLMLQELGGNGSNYHIFDSFQGLNQQYPGMFKASLDQVQTVLERFPYVNYHAGWIPDTFDGLQEKKYRFVHIDVDTPTPTVASLEYFYPRMSAGGVLVCDDYGSKVWEGLKDAVDKWVAQHQVRTFQVSTGQLVILV